jgi:hypothetical protein
LLTLVEDDAVAPETPPVVVLATGLSLAPTAPAEPAQSMCALTVGGKDERGNTVKYIYACDPDYVIYYSRLEHGAAGNGAQGGGTRPHGLRRLVRFAGRPVHDVAYESEGVQAQLSPVPAKRQSQRRDLLLLGTERAKLQALLSGWQRRQSYDSSIATALQLALDGTGDGTSDAASAKNAIETLTNARDAILSEREIAGRAQYAKFTLLGGLVGFLLLSFAQHNLFHGSGLFWLGSQAGLLGGILSIAIGIRKRTVALDIGVAGNLSDSALRLLIAAVSGGTLVLLFATGLLPSLHTLAGEMNGVQSMPFVLLLGIIAGFVEQLVPSLLEEQGQRMTDGGAAKVPPASGTAASPSGTTKPTGTVVAG